MRMLYDPSRLSLRFEETCRNFLMRPEAAKRKENTRDQPRFSLFIIDKDKGQLRRAYATVIKFRGEVKAPEGWGTITAGPLESMETALMSSWLVVEVRILFFSSIL